VTVVLQIDPRIEAMSERASLMAYRFVQEAMTNAFRHAGATRIDVSIRFETPAHEASLRDSALAGLAIRVADDGRGLQGETEAGMGLAGMRDRVRLLGGRYRRFGRRRSRGGGAFRDGRNRQGSGNIPGAFGKPPPVILQ